jgi:hypothetical protein
MITDSRNKGGTLTLDALEFAKQMTNVTMTPSVDEEGDRIETLDESTIEPDEITSWAMDLGAIQDFTDAAGFVEFARANDGEVVSFVWAPNGAGEVSYAGTVKVRAVPFGGDVNTRLTTTASWSVITGPTPTYPA